MHEGVSRATPTGSSVTDDSRGGGQPDRTDRLPSPTIHEGEQPGAQHRPGFVVGDLTTTTSRATPTEFCHGRFTSAESRKGRQAEPFRAGEANLRSTAPLRLIHAGAAGSPQRTDLGREMPLMLASRSVHTMFNNRNQDGPFAVQDPRAAADGVGSALVGLHAGARTGHTTASQPVNSSDSIWVL
jgi:hypothetical protein